MSTERNVVWQTYAVTPELRARQKHQKPCVIWLTGLSGSGKSSIASHLDSVLHQRGNHAYVLDGDNVRHGLNRDLGFSIEDRAENIRRVGEVAHLMTDAGLILITAFISPFRQERDMVRALFRPGEFIEVHVSTPIEVCESRDPKGLYRKARAGLIHDFTGIDSPYEAPLRAELTIDTSHLSVADVSAAILCFLEREGYLSPLTEPPSSGPLADSTGISG